jgi:hypothetical protein
MTMARTEPNTLSRAEIYKQLCEEFRSLNNLFWRVPVLAMTLNGAIGVALGSVKLTAPMQTALLLFVSACNLCFIAILWRLRMQVMEDVLNRIAEIEHRRRPKPRFHIIHAFTLVLLSASLFAFISIFYRDLFFPKSDMETMKVIIQNGGQGTLVLPQASSNPVQAPSTISQPPSSGSQQNP